MNYNLYYFKRVFAYGFAIGNLHNIKYDNKIINFVDGLITGRVKIKWINENDTAWYKNGLLYREDGGAAYYNYNSSLLYYIKGKELTKQEFIQWQKDNL